MDQLRSESMSKRLYCTMFIIMVAILLLTIPLLLFNYQHYIDHKKSLKEIESLEMMANLANQISKERAPANKLMSGALLDYTEHVTALQQHRHQLDIALEHTIQSLEKNNFSQVAHYLNTDFREELKRGREQVDAFAILDTHQRNAEGMDQAVHGMFKVWDSFHVAIQKVVMLSQGKEAEVANYYTLILLLSEFRDQAGRVASNIMSPVTFQVPMSETSIARTLQNKHQVRYLWSLVDVLVPEEDKNPQFLFLYQEVKKQFLDQTLPFVERLLQQSVNQQPYEVTGTGLTDAVVDQFKTVVALQNYLIEHSVEVAQYRVKEAEKTLLLLLLLVLITMSTVAFTLIYSKRHIFSPLIRARRLLLELSYHAQINQPEDAPHITKIKDEKISLFGAIQRLQSVLEQRDDLENQLKKIANSDSLTGVSNRFALSEYLKEAEKRPEIFKRTVLMLIDIDHFKQVNDAYGHTCGDRAIRLVADSIRKCIRSSDLVVRYGGDEFIVFLEQIELPRAKEIAETVLKEITVSQLPLKNSDEKISVSVSIGIAVGGEDWKSLFDQADQALFRAKAAGRNTVSS